MQLGLLRNNKLHINIPVLTDYHQAMYKILRKKIRMQKHTFHVRTHMFLQCNFYKQRCSINVCSY